MKEFPVPVTTDQPAPTTCTDAEPFALQVTDTSMETEQSIARREAAAAARKAQRELRAASAGRPGKRERRQLTDLKRFDGE